MNAVKVVALLMIVAGAIGMVYGRLSFTKDVRRATFGPFSIVTREPHDIVIPVWAAACSIVIGGLVLMTSKRGMRT
jgi:hypothetical protein